MGKTLTSSRHEDITLNSMTQTREKWDSLALSRTDSGILGRCHDIPSFYFLFYCLEATVKNSNSMRTISVTVMVVISNVLFWKLLDFSFVHSSFWTITRHTDHGIWKILYSWRFYGHGPTYMLTLAWVNIIKWKWVKMPWKLSVAQNSEPVLWKTLHQDISLITVFFFTSQANLVFKFNLVLTE